MLFYKLYMVTVLDLVGTLFCLRNTSWFCMLHRVMDVRKTRARGRVEELVEGMIATLEA